MTDTNATSLWKERAPVDAPAKRVTFFEDRAEVVRRVSCQVPAGTGWIVLRGIGVFVDDTSLVVRVKGDGARTLGTRVRRTVRDVPKAGPDEIAGLEQEARAARRRRKEAEQARERADQSRQRVRALMDSWCDAIARVPSIEENAAQSWQDAYASLDRQLVERLDEAARHGDATQAALLEEQRTELRLRLAKSVEPDYCAVVEVQLESQKEQSIEVEIVYRTPCAVWRPEHVARLVTRDDGSHELEVHTFATVWQSTGEVWDDVTCVFSTARPARSASPPLLSEDLLTSRRKIDAERRQVVAEERDEAVATVGLERGARQVDEMPGVDDGGEPLRFEASRPCTIVSDGQPFRVPLVERSMPCELERIAYPERTQAAHYRTRATLTGGTPLLAGPLWVARGTEIVGRSKTDYVAPGEPFELGMGIDDGVRVRRTFEERRETTPVIGTQKILRKVRLFISNLGQQTRSVHVVERYPISEIDDVHVEVVSHRDGRLEPNTGFVHYDVNLGARGTKELTFEYRVEAASRVVI